MISTVRFDPCGDRVMITRTIGAYTFWHEIPLSDAVALYYQLGQAVASAQACAAECPA